MRKRCFGPAVGLMVCFIAMASLASAQIITATVRGKVVDEQGGVLPGVTVTARQVATNTTRTVVTNEVGQYFLPNLPVGECEVSASLTGFAPAARPVELTVGAEFTVDFTLRVSSVSETVNVTGEAPLLETTRTVVGQTISKSQVDTLPTVNRDFLSLAQLAPGVSSGVGGNGPTLAINAQRGYQNNVVVDGASNNWQYYGKQASTFSQDWIQEFQVMTNSFSAEFGNASGGIMNVITRSGSNQYTGRAYLYYREKAFDSPPFAGYFENDDLDKPVFVDKDEVPDYTQRRWGGFLGGPIVKDRLFFFAGYEDMLRESNDALGISAFWRAQGYNEVEPVKTTDHPLMFKGDFNVTGSHRLSVRMDRTENKNVNASWYGSIAPFEGRLNEGGPVWNVVGNFTSVINNTTFNEFRGYFMSNMPPVTCNASGAAGQENLEIGPWGTFSHHRYPTLRVGCPIFHGLEGEENLGFVDNFSMIRGKHQFKIGAQAIQNRMVVDIANFHDGYWRFAQDKVFNIDDPTTYPYFWEGNIGPGAWKSPVWNFSTFAQDTWQVTDNLTLNLGLRFDVERSITQGNEFVDRKNQQIVATYGGSPVLEKTKVDYNNVSPRLGFVWTPTPDKRTTVRGAFGHFYDVSHGNFNAIYIVNTLLSEGFYVINCNNPVDNPFWNSANQSAGITQCKSFLANAHPFFPDLSKLTATTVGLDRIDVDFQVPRTQQFTGGVAHEFPIGMMVSADFVHSRGSGLVYLEKNVRLISPTEYELIDPRFSYITDLTNAGWVHYTALQLQAQYRKQSLNFGMSYTLSKADSNLPSGSIYGSSPTNPFDLDVDKGPDATDQRHNLVVNGSYMFPYDFQLSGMAVYRSARPWSPYTSENPEGLVYPGWPESKNSRRGDSYKTVDLRVGKTFKFGAKAGVTVFWEMFNTFNSQNFSGYDGEMESSSFGFPLDAGDMRRQQFGLRFDF
ncbi:MAG: TonB-dependent receptor domain-containing protein [Vicinamibacterales bacterium]